MTEEQRDNILNEMSKNLKKINVVLDEHSKELEKINAILEKHTEELTAQRQNMAKMEYNLIEKIMALFDLKNFNGEVFGRYVDTVPNLNRNQLLKLAT